MSNPTTTKTRRSRPETRTVRRPRLGFVGLGWIGLNRMQKLMEADIADVSCVTDPSNAAVDRAREFASAAEVASSLDDLLKADLDGVVIATPSALHMEQSRAALDCGLAVFCQKPLARTAEETRQIVHAARNNDCLLGVDFSYRYVRGMKEMRRLVRSGELGDVFLADLTFHNAYGPDKEWFYDPQLSGGGCVADLGIHLIDLAGWLLGEHRFSDVRSTVWHQGEPLTSKECSTTVEDAAIASWRYPNGPTARLTCSWNLSAGQDAVIEASLYGTTGSGALRNVGGSFYDFVVEHRMGTERIELAGPPDKWGGRALVAWAQKLAEGNRFDPEIEHVAIDAELIDRIYGR